ncbi:hypothetical protein ASA1KI_00330 [Opitutales bacterium ASA1]|nr:hypothetical protein ASA1KI_00330 [Opitutales bacterium ASA1]
MYPRTQHLSFTGVPSPSRSLHHSTPRTESPWSPSSTVSLDPFVGWLLAHAGLDATCYRASALARRLPACLRALRTTSTAQARLRLERDPTLVPQAIDALLLGVTEFFRDPAVFTALRERVLPLVRTLALDQPIRIWSAACSNGAELYSVALLLAEAGLLDRVRLLGTDCRASAIRQARDGVYPLAAIRDVDRARFPGLVSVDGAHVRIAGPLRERVDWEVRDVLRTPTAGTWDLVLWRNMAIYLEPTAAREAWARMTDALVVGGFLVTGKAESPPAGETWLRTGPCIHRKRVPRPSSESRILRLATTAAARDHARFPTARL